MPRPARLELIKKLEKLRSSTVLCYLTSLRPNVGSQMADDSVRVVFDHLLLFPSRPIDKLDIFLCSNGGSGTVPWRLVSVFREFAKSISVLVPYRAYSAATLLSLGADEIVMHPFGELGPIDPTVANEFNPVEQGTGRRIGISVEDVKAYVSFIKSSVGITHEDELVRAVEVLANKVHPLALGNVERFLAQSRMIATKIMRTHMGKTDHDHAIKEIVENLASKLYFHGHPINRREAKDDLKLKVNLELAPTLEKAMWDLYVDFEQDFENQKVFNPAADLAAMAPVAGATPPAAGAAPSPQIKTYTLIHAMIESTRLASQFTTQRRYQYLATPQGQALQEELLSQAWTHSLEPPAESPKVLSSTVPAGTPAAPKRRGQKRAKSSKSRQTTVS